MVSDYRCPRKTCVPGNPCEACFRGQVAALARLQGWRVFHATDTADNVKTDSDPGFPDLALLRRREAGGVAELLFLETKRLRGKLTEDQGWWLTTLNAVESVSAHMVKPDDWEKIERMLARE